MNKTVLQFDDVCFAYKTRMVLDGCSFGIKAGETIALVAPSGAGKTTLLQLAGLLDVQTSGKILLDGDDVHGMSQNARANIRAHKIGFVFQFHHLLSEFNVIENLQIAARLGGQTNQQSAQWIDHLLSRLGVSDLRARFVGQLSGGERQRVAIARALVNRPQLLLADEPTGNLDQENAQNIFSLLLELIKETNMSVLLATHNKQLAQQLDSTNSLSFGKYVMMDTKDQT